MMIGMNGRVSSALIRRATSIPSMRGIITSRRIRSGGDWRTRSNASSPSAALSIWYPLASRRARMTSTLSSWSSTMRMRVRGDPSAAIALPEELLHLAHHGFRLAGLGEVAVAAHLHRLLTVRRERVRGERDDRDMLGVGVALEYLGRLPAIDDRDGDIHQDQVGLFGACLGDAFLAIERLHDPIPEVLQDGGINDAVVFVVLNEKHRLGVVGHASPQTEIDRSGKGEPSAGRATTG